MAIGKAHAGRSGTGGWALAAVALLALPSVPADPAAAAPGRVPQQVVHSGVNLMGSKIGVSRFDEAIILANQSNGVENPSIVARVRGANGQIGATQELSRGANADLPADIEFNSAGGTFLSWFTDGPTGEHASRPRGGLFTARFDWFSGGCTRFSSVRFLATGVPQVACTASVGGSAPNVVLAATATTAGGFTFLPTRTLQTGVSSSVAGPILDVGPDGTRAAAWIVDEGSSFTATQVLKLAVAAPGAEFSPTQTVTSVLVSIGGWVTLSDISVLADGRVALAYARWDGVTTDVKIALRAPVTGTITDTMIPSAREGALGVERDGSGALVHWNEDAGFATPVTVKVASLAAGPTLTAVQTLDRTVSGLNVRGLKVASNGAAAIVRDRPASGSDMTIGAWVRSARGRPFEGPFTIGTTDATFGQDFAVDRFGSVASVWIDDNTAPTADRVIFGGLDAAGPVLSSLRVPGRLRVGRTGSFSVRSIDPSGVKSVRWSFGDRGAAFGGGVRHAYRRTGRYRVTVVATDKAGKQSRASRVIRVVR